MRQPYICAAYYSVFFLIGTVKFTTFKLPDWNVNISRLFFRDEKINILIFLLRERERKKNSIKKNMKGDIIRTNALTKKKCLNLYKCHRPEWLNNLKKKTNNYLQRNGNNIEF